MILHGIDQHREELLQFAAGLVATPRPNLPGDERAVVAVILAEMQRLGLTSAEIAEKMYALAAQTYLSWPRGSRVKPTLLCYYRVVPMSRWAFE